MSTGPTPDYAGFAAAQENLRQSFGQDVRFFKPATMLYDPALPASEFDDEGIPLDPLAGASAVAVTSVDGQVPMTVTGSARANVVWSPLQTSLLRRDQTYETQLGIRSGLNKDLILNAADAPLTSGSTHFQLGTSHDDGSFTPEDGGELWKIVNIKPDNAIGSFERYIVWGQGTR